MEERAASEEWIAPAEAVDLIEPYFRDRRAAKDTLADLLKEGSIRARAEKLWESNEPTINDAWHRRDDAEFETDVVVKPSVWRSSRHWDYDLSLWRWAENRFVITQRKNPADRTIIVGLSFAKSDILTLLTRFGSTGSRRGRGGRAPKMDEWAAFWMVVLELAQNGKLNMGNFASQEKLKEEILAGITPSHRDSPLLSAGSIEPYVRGIWNRFVEGNERP